MPCSALLTSLGGFCGNIPRILPESVDVEIDTSAWNPLPIFKLIEQAGMIDFDEMYEVFNMGMGMTLCVDASKECHAHGCRAAAIGSAVKGSGKVHLMRAWRWVRAS